MIDLSNKTPDEKADLAIKTMVASMAAAGAVPIFIEWPICMAAMGAGVVAIGKAYGVELSKESAWKLALQFIKAAGLCYSGLFIGTKIIGSILKFSGFGYVGGAALDAAMCAALAYAIGACAKAYFKGEKDKEKLATLFREQFAATRKNAAGANNGVVSAS